MNNRTFRPVSGLVAVLSALFSLQAAAQSHRCAEQFDDAQRLACYDATFGKPKRAAAPAARIAPAIVAAPAAVATAPAITPALPAATIASAPPAQVTATVTAVSRARSGRFAATLANGQVWTQLEPDSRVEIAVGDTVAVRPAALGSYQLVTKSGLPTRVKLAQ